MSWVKPTKFKKPKPKPWTKPKAQPSHLVQTLAQLSRIFPPPQQNCPYLTHLLNLSMVFWSILPSLLWSWADFGIRVKAFVNLNQNRNFVFFGTAYISLAKVSRGGFQVCGRKMISFFLVFSWISFNPPLLASCLFLFPERYQVFGRFSLKLHFSLHSEVFPMLFLCGQNGLGANVSLGCFHNVFWRHSVFSFLSFCIGRPNPFFMIAFFLLH